MTIKRSKIELIIISLTALAILILFIAFIISLSWLGESIVNIIDTHKDVLSNNKVNFDLKAFDALNYR